VDGALRVLVNGRTLLAWDQPSQGPTANGAARNDPGLTVADGAVTLRRVAVKRDFHYAAAGPWGAGEPFPVPAGHVFLLGDNARRSRDSRTFAPVALGALRGRPFLRYAPSGRCGWLGRMGVAP
jgi:hypothetical protein